MAEVRKRAFSVGLNVRTDLAIEETERLADETGSREIPGVKVEEEIQGAVKITRVSIQTEEGAHAMGKEIGTYVTVEAPPLLERNRILEDGISKALAKEFSAVAALKPDQSVLVVGLGNWNATPDALGPKVVGEILVTRHLRDYVPPELKGNLRAVAAISPGVLGLTGIETMEIVKGIVDRIRPDLVVAVDALCARNIQRILSTIQIADTGISPGSGVGNRRTGLNRDTLGVPVVAIGVPTVVRAITIASETIDTLVNRLSGFHKLFQILRAMGGEDKEALIDEVLRPSVGSLVVTPKEIDTLIQETSRVIAGGLNAALHPNITAEDISRYLMG
ncbi:MAG TPA: GPR endopeptidase [Clostridia bacterium]|nr:GPR endopeptidase [Clostridia bacterium]